MAAVGEPKPLPLTPCKHKCMGTIRIWKIALEHQVNCPAFLLRKSRIRFSTLRTKSAWRCFCVLKVSHLRLNAKKNKAPDPLCSPLSFLSGIDLRKHLKEGKWPADRGERCQNIVFKPYCDGLPLSYICHFFSKVLSSI